MEIRRSEGKSPEIPAPKFKKGDVLRYGFGETALFEVETVSRNHGGDGSHRYWGSHLLGGPIGAYERSCSVATEKDMERWRRQRGS